MCNVIFSYFCHIPSRTKTRLSETKQKIWIKGITPSLRYLRPRLSRFSFHVLPVRLINRLGVVLYSIPLGHRNCSRLLRTQQRDRLSLTRFKKSHNISEENLQVILKRNQRDLQSWLKINFCAASLFPCSLWNRMRVTVQWSGDFAIRSLSFCLKKGFNCTPLETHNVPESQERGRGGGGHWYCARARLRCDKSKKREFLFFATNSPH